MCHGKNKQHENRNLLTKYARVVSFWLHSLAFVISNCLGHVIELPGMKLTRGRNIINLISMIVAMTNEKNQ